MHFWLVSLSTSVRVLSFIVGLSGGSGRETAASGRLRPGGVTAGQQVRGGETGGDSLNSTSSLRDAVPPTAVPQSRRSGTKRPTGVSK